MYRVILDYMLTLHKSNLELRMLKCLHALKNTACFIIGEHKLKKKNYCNLENIKSTIYIDMTFLLF